MWAQKTIARSDCGQRRWSSAAVWARAQSAHMSDGSLAGGLRAVRAGVGSAREILFPISSHFPIFSNDLFSNNQCCSNLGKHKINPS
jgi:hypothetical protein